MKCNAYGKKEKKKSGKPKIEGEGFENCRQDSVRNVVENSNMMRYLSLKRPKKESWCVYDFIEQVVKRGFTEAFL